MDRPTAFVLSFGLLIFMKIFCFFIGYLVVRLGYDLLKRGIKGEFKFSTEMDKVKVGLASVSPGLLFVLLGCLIIGYAMFVEKELKFIEPMSKHEVLSQIAPVVPEPLPEEPLSGENK
jgi:hypothetical protein